MPGIVEIENLTKTYRRGSVEIPVLEGIDLEVEEKELLALMGPSGSGKTTLLNIIAGIDAPTSGLVRVTGHEITTFRDEKLSRWRLRTIGYVFQMHHLVPVLTAWENVELPLLLLPMSKKERKKHADTALDAVGLLHRAEHYPRQLSGGEEQRAAIARAIVTDPRIIVADEPTGDLDANSAVEILQLLRELGRRFEKTLIMVTHDPDAAAIADRTLHLHKGVVREGALPVGRATETEDASHV